MADRYWVGGSASWDATAGTKWSLTSGGAGGSAVPTSSDDVYIDSGSGAVTVTVAASSVCLSLKFVSGAGSFAGTFAGSSAISMSGSFVASASMTWTYSGTLTAAATTAQTITSNGKALDCPITFNGVAGSWALQDALTTGSSRTVTLTNGSLNLNGFNLTAGAFSSSNTNVRSITSGAGQFYCTFAASSGTSSPFNADVTTNLTFADRPTINVTGNGSGTAIRRISLVVGQTEALAPDVNVTAGTDTVGAAVTSNMPMRNLNFTGFSGVLTGTIRVVYGNLTLSPTMTAAATVNTTYFSATSGTQTITSNGVALDFPIIVSAVGATVQLADALTLGSTRTFTLSNGSLDLNGFNLTAGAFSSSNANVRSITSGAGQFYLTGTSGSVWNTGTITNLTLVDRPIVNVTGSPSSGTRAIGTGSHAESVAPNVNITGGTDTLTMSVAFGAVNFTGFAGVLGNATRTIYGNLTLSATMTATAGTLTTTFAATSGTQVLTSNGVTLAFPIAVNAVGGTVQLADALTMAAGRLLSVGAGTFDANNKNVTCGSYGTGLGAFTRVTSMGTGTWTILDAGATAWSTPAAASHTVTPSTSTILMTAATAKTFAGGGRTFWNLSNGGAGALSITGANTFNDLQNTVTPATFTLPASTTTTVSALSLAGTAGNLVTLDSSSSGTPATLSKASGGVDVSFLSIKDSAATGGATWNAPLSAGNIDGSGNVGWNFFPKTAQGQNSFTPVLLLG